MTTELAEFLDLVARPSAVPAGELSHRLTESLDTSIRHLAGRLDPARVALVATGGYGAGWMCLHSDVDLMVLHRGRIDVATIRSLLHPLWDSGLRVGHAVRTPREVASAARDRLDTLTSLVTSRHLWGDQELYDDMRAQLGKLLRRQWKRTWESWLGEEAARRDAEPYRAMASNIKTGRSGLRSLQLITWFSAAHVLMGRDEHEGEDTASAGVRDVLLEIRNAVHAVAGRRHETLDLELRGPVARFLDSDVASLLSRLMTARAQIEVMLDERWGSQLEPGPGPRPIEVPATNDPTLAAASHALVEGRRFTTTEREMISNAGPPSWTAAERAVIIALVTDQWGRKLWRELARLGWMRKAIPEWSHTVALPHLVPFHVHPVADHLLRTVEEVVGDRANRTLDEDDEMLLALAALVHDVGKGRHGDHSQIGGALAEGMGMRMQLSHRDSADLGAIVRHHLVLPDLATRFDLDDPDVVEAAVDQIGSLRVLELLFHLSKADSKATGSDTWTPWKESLLVRAHHTIRAAFEAADAELSIDRSEVRVATAVDPALVDAHLDAVPVGYLRAVPIEVMAQHVELLDPAPAAGEIRIRATPADTTTHVAVVATDRAGLVSDIAGVFALRNVSVIDARCFTRSDGVAVDLFEVVDVLTGKAVPVDRFAAVETDLLSLADGSLDLSPAVARKREDYRSTIRPGVTTGVHIRKQPGSWIIEVTTADRPGLLHDLCAVFSKHGLDISRARIDTRGGQVVDAFYVAEEPADIASLEAHLLDAAL